MPPRLRRTWHHVAVVAATVAVMVAACSPAKKGPPLCSRYLGSTGQVQSNDLTEISGIVASTKNTGVMWAHNDSGDGARVFAVAANGGHLGWFTLGSGATNVDWEAIALGPGPQAGRSYLYIGDIGDNAQSRASIAVYRVEEPAIDVNNPPGDGQTLGGVQTFVLTYPDGPHDAEALLIDPVTGDLVIVTKEFSGPAGIYTFPAPLANGTLSKAGTLGTTLITAGDVAPHGGTVLLRTYGSVLVFTRAPGASVASALQSAPCTGASVSEPQGEAIAFAPDGQSYATISEGAHPPIHAFGR